mmetsp:Transcript_134379/g.233567  ORF Transcript_134379/g.233567 Transcript_134379/m.233567 type:complete len:83 (+) Transcript_134379:112-360(+)
MHLIPCSGKDVKMRKRPTGNSTHLQSQDRKARHESFSHLRGRQSLARSFVSNEMQIDEQSGSKFEHLSEFPMPMQTTSKPEA